MHHERDISWPDLTAIQFVQDGRGLVGGCHDGVLLVLCTFSVLGGVLIVGWYADGIATCTPVAGQCIVFFPSKPCKYSALVAPRSVAYSS